MAKKKKQVVWHKRQAKFISAHYLKPQTHKVIPPEQPVPSDDSIKSRKRKLSQNLTTLIKKAVRESQES